MRPTIYTVAQRAGVSIATVSRVLNNQPLVKPETKAKVLQAMDAYGLELADFARAVLDGTELAAGPEESLGELRTALAMYRSAESRQWEKVWD
jgi:predicted dehydrogenase